MNIQPFLALDGNGVPAPPPPLGQIQPPPAGAAVPPPPFPGAPGGGVPIVPGIQQYGGHPAPQQQQPHVVPPPQPHIQLAPPVIPPGQVPVAPLAGIPQAMGGFNQVPGLAALLQNQNIPPAERQAMAAVAQAIVPNMGGMGLAVPGQYVPPGRLAENEVERKAENGCVRGSIHPEGVSTLATPVDLSMSQERRVTSGRLPLPDPAVITAEFPLTVWARVFPFALSSLDPIVWSICLRDYPN
eukprot:342550_1